MRLNKMCDGVKSAYSKMIAFIINLFTKIIPDFFKANFEVSYTKATKIIALVVFVILETTTVISLSSFLSLTSASKWWLLLAAAVIPVIVGVVIIFNIKIKNNKINTALHFSMLFLMPFVTIVMTEALNKIFVYDMTYLGFIANYVLILIFYFIVYAISGSLKITIIINSAVLFGFALAHAYIMEFRGTPFIPMDFLSITTAVGVANTYNYSPTYNMVIAIEIFAFLVSIGFKAPKVNVGLITKIISRSFTGLFSSIILLVFFCTSFFADLGVRPDFWNQSRGYRNYGFAFSFFCNTKYLYMSTPEGYDPDDVKDLVSSTIKENEQQKPPINSNAPNIICIMNESLSDLSVLGEFTTNKDYMPFIRSLKKNTIKGNLYVPVIGAGTSNTEFEFLTGHTTAFLPSGSNAYMLYMKNPVASLTSTLDAQGYYALAFHPYYAAGWNRTSVYKNLGFDLFKSLEHLFDVTLMDKYVQNGSDPDYLQSLIDQYYPGKNMLVRQYISDAYNYEVLIKDFEKRDKSRPYYVFNVTMQNHGGYTTTAQNFEQEIFLTSTENEYNKTNSYLSLVKKSDDAFKKLIKYFSKVKEPTVICMFGDHQPSIESSFIAELLGVKELSGLTIEQEQKRHMTPFIIWANYDIEEKQIDALSANYLSSLVLKTAGVELTEYNKYLLSLSETLPVISAVGYMDKDGNHYQWSDNSPYSELLSQYERIQYNNIFDRANIDMDTFYLPGYVIPEAEEMDEIPHAEGVIQ